MPAAPDDTTGPEAELRARVEVLETVLDMSRRGLSPGRSGNVSQRFGNGMLITPSGLAYDSLTPADVVSVAHSGAVAEGQRKPSSEWLFHLAAYRQRADMGGIVHTHSLHATVLACAHRPIPAFHYMVAIAGGNDIPLIPYATFGSKKLARLVAKGLRSRDASLMANHGQIAVGPTCATALDLASAVEVLAEQFYKVLTLGKPNPLDDKEMAHILTLFQSYGQNAQNDDVTRSP